MGNEWTWRRLGAWRRLAIVAAASLAMPALVGRSQNLPSGQVPSEPQGRQRDRAVELAMKIPGTFTLAAVGDVMARRPLSTWEDPGFQSVLRIVRGAEVGFGNLEGNLADLPRFEGPLRGMMGSRDTARDLKAMGFDAQHVERERDHPGGQHRRTARPEPPELHRVSPRHA